MSFWTMDPSRSSKANETDEWVLVSLVGSETQEGRRVKLRCANSGLARSSDASTGTERTSEVGGSVGSRVATLANWRKDQFESTETRTLYKIPRALGTDVVAVRSVE